MSDFDGVINPPAEWASVPQLSRSAIAVGGQDGCMNAQAVALTKRSNAMLRMHLERVARDLGLNLVAGSFEEGATLTHADDAIIHYAGQQLYTWGGTLPKTVHINSTPAMNGGIGPTAWVDKTGVARDSTNPLTLENIPVANILAALRADKAVNVNLVPIADSFGDGVGASVYGNRYLKMFEAAINHANIGGFGYAVDTRLTDVVNESGSGITTNGTVTSQGSLESRVNLSAGQYIELTGFQADYFDLWYEGGLTTGDAIIYLNGTQVRSITTTKTAGIKNTFTAFKLGQRTAKSDVIRIQATGGAVSVSALMPLRGPTGGVWQAKVSHGGWSYKTYNQMAIVDEIGAYAQFRGAYVAYLLLIGTNSIYNGSEAQTPAEMIASMQGFIANLAAKTPNCGFIIGVPPRANETIWPVIKPGYSHADYVSAIVNFCTTNGVQCIRFDTIGLYEKSLYSDGVHPDDRGHVLYFKKLCDAVGIPAVAYIDDMEKKEVTQPEVSSSVHFNSTWGTFLNDQGSIPRVRRVGNIGYLSGAVQANGSSDLTVMTIPAEYKPLLRNVNCAGFDASGAKQVSILEDGRITITSLPNTFLSFEISWVIDNA